MAEIESPDTVIIRYTIAAPRERVFAAWTTPEQLRQWWGPTDFTCPEAEVDLRPGGGYRLQMQSPDGMVMTVGGTYDTVEPPQLLAYTWRWLGPPMDSEPESHVTVEFHDVEGDTEVVITHGRFPRGHDLSQYDVGWQSGLQKLERLLV